MYSTEYSPTYSMYDHKTSKSTHIGNFDNFIYFLLRGAKCEYGYSYDPYYFVENQNLTMNDTWSEVPQSAYYTDASSYLNYSKKDRVFWLRRYTFFEDERIVDIGKYKNIFDKWILNTKPMVWGCDKRKALPECEIKTQVYKNSNNHDWKYKMDIWNFHSWWRKVKTTNERRANADSEISIYVRGTRSPKNLPNYFDDIRKSVDTSWKRRYKCKKQWMIKWTNAKDGC